MPPLSLVAPDTAVVPGTLIPGILVLDRDLAPEVSKSKRALEIRGERVLDTTEIARLGFRREQQWRASPRCVCSKYVRSRCARGCCEIFHDSIAVTNFRAKQA